ncbi:MAG: PhoH family protein [candidate division KSB1 bacterium]|nr:PhoH family protein [candidate division KSB1 bacterium]MDZ7335669.1 PhoH family protein [candidate division KSB1 bacterium]MDZ7357712.1 PhoH family protein [candidate division KSB1 bacterium]MDZ7402046.1 PhoH family protein [candidate division KSB1 bacterium]
MSIEIQKKISIRGVNQLQLFGFNDINLRRIEKNFGTKLIARGDEITLVGAESEIQIVEQLLLEMIKILERNQQITENDLTTLIEVLKSGETIQEKPTDLSSVVLYTKDGYVKPKTEGQKRYCQAAMKNDIVFVIGPAGTGKTYLAVAIALAHLRDKLVDKLVLARPAVEAGESLGFLPGDLLEKVDPYLKPLYDALFDMVIPAKLKKYMENGTIEIVPLAYMRGRTLNHAFVILDEAQNTYPNQMKMFLTRLGINSKAIITGDITQIDLPNKKQSGLVQIQKILQGIEGIDYVYLSERDVVRHRLVREIIKAYDRFDSNQLETDESNSGGGRV